VLLCYVHSLSCCFLSLHSNGGPGGIFGSYLISVVISPPTVDFRNNALQGLSRATILVEGRPLFGLGSNAPVVEVSADAVIAATLPVYDSVTGILGNVNLANVELQDPVFDFKNGEPLFGIATGLVFSIISTVFNGIIDIVLVLANSLIKAFLDENPLLIPLIPNFPTSGKATKISIQGTTVNGVASGPGTDGFLDIDGGVQIDVIDLPPDFELPVDPDNPDGGADNIFEGRTTPSDNSIFKAGAYKRAYEMTLEWNNPDATYFSSFSDPVSGDEERCMFRLSRDDEDGEVQVRCDPEDDWGPAPAPAD